MFSRDSSCQRMIQRLLTKILRKHVSVKHKSLDRRLCDYKQLNKNVKMTAALVTR